MSPSERGVIIIGKLPAFLFYPGDWRRDTQVQMASMETRGVWFEMLCCMWDSPERGKLSGTIPELSRMIGCTDDVFEKAINEINRLKIADVTFCNTNITVCNRRMVREQKDRENTRLRVKKHRHVTEMYGECNANVTTPLSVSSSFSVTKDEKNKEKDSCSEPEKPVSELIESLKNDCQTLHEYLKLKIGCNWKFDTWFKTYRPRISKYGLEECKKAVDGFCLNSWNLEHIAAKAPDFIFRSDKKVDEFIEAATNLRKGSYNGTNKPNYSEFAADGLRKQDTPHRTGDEPDDDDPGLEN